MSTGNRFLQRNPEKSDLNQYWFSQHTIDTLVREIEHLAASHERFSVACVSTPSLFFTLPPQVRSCSKVLDFDRKFAADTGFVFYDFNNPTDIPEPLRGTFDLVVIDPPFITREVWSKYAETAKLLLRASGLIILSSIVENEAMLRELLDVSPVAFQPSIPHLVYQYSFYTNYPTHLLAQRNPELQD